MRKSLCNLGAVVLVGALATCGGGSVERDGGAGPPRDGGAQPDAAVDDGRGDNPLGQNVPTGTGDAVVDRLAATAAACGYQTPNTVPAGWNMVPVGERGCAISVPPGWTAEGAGGPVCAAEQPPDGATGVLVMMGTPDLVASVPCTPRGATTYLEQNVAESGCANVTERHYREGTELIATIPIPKADVVFTCEEEGATFAAYAWVTIQGTSPLCSILVLGFWTPVGDVEATTCTLTQILQSVRCPQPGGNLCVDADCAADCVRTNRGTRGECAEDVCVCR